MHAQASDRGLHVVNLNDAAARESNRTVVSQLTAHLGVEGGAVQDHLDLRGSGGCRGLHSIDEKRLNRGLGCLLGVAEERRAAAHRLFDVMEHADVGVSGLLRAGVGACALLLLGHESAEALLINGHALFGGHLQGQIDREPVGVV